MFQSAASRPGKSSTFDGAGGLVFNQQSYLFNTNTRTLGSNTVFRINDVSGQSLVTIANNFFTIGGFGAGGWGAWSLSAGSSGSSMSYLWFADTGNPNAPGGNGRLQISPNGLLISNGLYYGWTPLGVAAGATNVDVYFGRVAAGAASVQANSTYYASLSSVETINHNASLSGAI